jgi:Carboxypeptidase regulatory-like domain
MRLRPILLNRFVIVPTLIAVAVVLWNSYVALHAHGLVAGRVVDAAGAPVADATVILFNQDFVTQVEKARTRTDAAGDFRFTNNQSHLIELQAIASQKASPRITVHLWFRAQDRNLSKPLRLTMPSA